MRKLQTAPKQLIENGVFNLGCFGEPIHDLNFLDADCYSKLFRNFLLREWQAFQLFHPEWFGMIALYNTKKIGIVQLILFHKTTGRKIRYEKKVPASKIKLPNNLLQSEASYKGGNWQLIAQHDLNANELSLKGEINGKEKLPNLTLNLKAEHDLAKYAAMISCQPFSKKRAMYSHKCLMPVQGEILIGKEKIVFNSAESSLIIDEHKGFYPYPTIYDWATAAGFDKKGHRIGFNLTNNQCIEPTLYNENCFWIDGNLIYLSPVNFRRNEGANKWEIRDEAGDVNLTFEIKAKNDVKMNLLLLVSKYSGPYGYFNGEIRSQTGEVYKIDNLFGMAEDFYLKS